MGYTRIHISRLEHEKRHPSKQFLRLLALTIALTPTEMEMLAAFEQMAEYHCEDMEIEEGGSSA